MLSAALETPKGTHAFHAPVQELPATPSSILPLLISRFLEKNGVSATDLNALWITQGPGALTRKRLQQTLSGAFKASSPSLEVYGVDLIAVLSQGILNDHKLKNPTTCHNTPVALCIDLYNGSFFLSIFNKNKSLLAKTVSEKNILQLLCDHDVEVLWGEEISLKKLDSAEKNTILKIIQPCVAVQMAEHKQTLSNKLKKLS